MATELSPTLMGLQMVGADVLRQRWGWFFALGVVLVILGVVALSVAYLVTLMAVVVAGWLMILGGLLEFMHSACCKQWGGFFLDLFTGLLYIVVGIMLIAHPAEFALGLTLLIAVLLIVGGLFRVIVGLSIQYQNRFWIVIHGMVSLILGVMIWRQWPLDGLWVIGMFVGIDMIFNGWALIMLGLAARNLPVQPA